MKKLYSAEDCESLTIEEVRELYQAHVSPSLTHILNSFSTSETLIASAEGVWLKDKTGRMILDVTGGTGVLNLGHNPPSILKERIRYQEQKKMEVYKSFFSPYLAALSYNLAQLSPGDLDYPYFWNSGAEAAEGALKLAFKYHGGSRRTVLHSDIAFHGKLLGSGSITPSSSGAFQFPTLLAKDIFKYGDATSFQEALDRNRNSAGASDIYAIIVEPYSATHLKSLSPDFLRQLRTVCDKEDIILIFDEVYSGWYKTGPRFAFMITDIIPDVMLTSKTLGGGKASISAYISRAPILKKAYGKINEALLHSTTYNGFGEECITAIESLNLLAQGDFGTHSRVIGETADDLFQNLVTKHASLIREKRGRGCIHGIFLKSDIAMLQNLANLLPVPLLQDPKFIEKLLVASVIDRLFSHHDIYCLMMNTQNPAILFAPSLNITKKEVEIFFDALDKTLSEGLLSLATSFAFKRFKRFFSA